MTRAPFRARHVLLPLLWWAVAGTPAGAQLISPGALSRPHAGLEGIRSCTKCHELRKPGISASLCLDCHAPLAERIRAGEGYHAELEGDCASCHAEHFGRGFDLLRFDSLAFDHASTGYALEGKHAEAACATCHRRELTTRPSPVAFRLEHRATGRSFLGLPTSCASCHREEDPHGGQFGGEGCQSCHDPVGWEEARGFDHLRARYPLTGKHREVSCRSCHVGPPAAPAATVWKPLGFDGCASCHEDPHDGVMEGRCESCHGTEGWARVDPRRLADRFDHSVTGYPLAGAHGGLACASCHDEGAARALAGIRIELRGASGGPFPEPVAEACQSCHLDFHEGLFGDRTGGAECSDCHGEQAWLPALWDVARHAAETSFPLDGAHEAAPCSGCHRVGETLVLAPEAGTCRTCHAADDPHGDELANDFCETCHSTASFETVAFDHGPTGFPLDGAHAPVPCAGCHGGGADSLIFVTAPPACAACHEAEDPHGGQFPGRSCDRCHSTAAFTIGAFDHSATPFPLDGAHEGVPCTSCHLDEVGPSGRLLVRWVGLGTRCRDCHEGAP
jgi:hypothetical protein